MIKLFNLLLSILFNITMILYTCFFGALVWVVINDGNHEVSAVFVILYVTTLSWFIAEENKHKQR
ncbi:hypothetical protein WQ54_01815 [Bacillus sp. SA1-12]|uniref:hypothetical protein n=1 Tax=Bacillus sp. SA1-12 TaxID=1455638 RepID=UPI00062524B1|nr:hypothetical protein [Bacillus sp. SA1-12]KKI93814.1 hypothetical protein WQ54_01815 [Bacillus sp. SA1-12]